MAKLPKVFWPVTIDNTNKFVDFKIGAGGNEQASIPAATYYSIATLLAAMTAALQAIHANAWASSVSATGIVTITGSSTFRLLFSTGALAAQSPRTLLGIGVVDTPLATSAVATDQHTNGWYARKAVNDSKPAFESIGNTNVSLGGNVQTIDDGEIEHRSIELPMLQNYQTLIDAEPAARAIDGVAHNNAAIERWWRNGRGRFRYWQDATVEGTSTDYALDDKTTRSFAPVRPFIAKELYTVRFGFLRYN